jgi:hypothetical protein
MGLRDDEINSIESDGTVEAFADVPEGDNWHS